jgi:hypothetical protein
MAHTLSTTRKLAAVGLVLVWAAGTVAAFWWFEFRNLRTFLPEQVAMFQADQLGDLAAEARAPNTGSGPVIMHFWDPACPCTRFTTPHLQDILATYAGRGLGLVVLVPEAGLKDAARETFGAMADVRVAGTLNPVSSPAAVLLDTRGELAYFGPYSTGAGCTTGAGSFVESVLDALDAGYNPRQVNTLATGCFCRWPDAKSA